MPVFPRYSGPPLIDKICSVENLTLAYRQVRSNIRVAQRGRSCGIDAVTLRDFEADWPRQMNVLADELYRGGYRPLPARIIAIPKRSGGQRAISILTIRDRIAQRAAQQVLDPLFDPLFLDCSFGCRPGVGVPEAIAQVMRYAELGMTWVVDADIATYYDTIDQQILLGLLRQRIAEPAVLRLIAAWLQAHALAEPDGEVLQGLSGAYSLLQRGQQALSRIFTTHDPPSPSMLSWGDDQADNLGWPTGAAPDYGNVWGAPGGFDQRIWTALGLVQPVINATRPALPYLRRIGGRRLALAAGVAAGTVTAAELASRLLQPQRRGTAQGGAISPLLANTYLHPFDLALTSHGLRLVRFMDDFVIMCATRRDAERALELAQKQLATLRLTLHVEKTRIVDYSEGIEFLGQSLAPQRRGSRLGEGLQSFGEAERALRAAAAQARRPFRRKK